MRMAKNLDLTQDRRTGCIRNKRTRKIWAYDSGMSNKQEDHIMVEIMGILAPVYPELSLYKIQQALRELDISLDIPTLRKVMFNMTRRHLAFLKKDKKYSKTCR